MFYVKLDEFVDINKMVESVLDISSMKSLNNAYCCKFTFNIIGHYIINKFYVCALCITCHNIAELKLNKMSCTSCEPYFSLFEIKRLFRACCSEQLVLFSCSYSSLKQRNLVQMCLVHSPKVFPYTCGTIEYERYITKPLHELSIKNYWNTRHASFTSIEMFDFAKIKHDNLNQMSGLKEIFVLPFSKLISGSQNLRNYSSHRKGNNVHMNYKEDNEQSSTSNHSNWHMHPLSIFFRLFSGEQKQRTSFFEERKDDRIIPRTSTFTLNSKDPFKVKAKLDSKSFWFPPIRLLLGLYDYRFKHIAVMEEGDCNRNIASTPVGLAQFLDFDGLESRTTLFQGGEDDMTTTTNNMLQPPSQATPTPVQVFDGPITRSRAKKLQQEVHALLSENHFNVNENYILPKSCTLLLLRCTTEDDKKTPRVNQRGGSRSSQSRVTEPSERISHNVLLAKAMKAHEDLLESLSSLVSSPSSLT
jgi:hypothetical protein